MLRNFFCMGITAVWSGILCPFAILAGLLRRDTGATVRFVRKYWAPVLLWAGGAELVIHGREHVDPKRPTLYVCNHQSTIDIPALMVALPVDVRFVAKSQLRWAPFIGWVGMASGQIFIDRSKRTKSFASLEEAARKITSGRSVIIFPEGTRSPDGRVLPFKKGPFALALAASAPVCPVTVEGSGKLMPKNRWKITPGKIHVKIGPPVDVRPFAPKDREGLARLIRGKIIDQSLELGGLGGDREDAIALPGKDGIGARTRPEEHAA